MLQINSNIYLEMREREREKDGHRWTEMKRERGERQTDSLVPWPCYAPRH